MWLLLLILVSPSIPGETVLDQFETYDACHREGDRITEDFLVSYPDDHDYVLECRFQERVT